MTRHKVIFDTGHYLNKKRKINTNNNMTQRLDKTKSERKKRFETQTRTLTQNGPEAQEK